MSEIIYHPRTIAQIRIGDVPEAMDAKGITRHHVSVEGIVAASSFKETIFDEKSNYSREEWGKIYGSGLAVGFLYDPNADDRRDQFLSFAGRTRINDGMGKLSDLVLMLEVSKNTKIPIHIQGQVRGFDTPRVLLHSLFLTNTTVNSEGFNYKTHDFYQLDKLLLTS